MAHPLTAHLGLGYLNSAFITDNAFVADSLIFPAKAFEVLGRPEYSFTEKSVSFRLESTIVYSFRLGYFTIRPASNLLR
jgi:hypothetical protein